MLRAQAQNGPSIPQVRSEAVQIAKHVQYVELTTEPGFTDTLQGVSAWVRCHTLSAINKRVDKCPTGRAAAALIRFGIHPSG